MLRSPSIWFTSTLLTLAVAPGAIAQTQTQKVAIEFQGRVGNSSFICGLSYGEMGTDDATITPTDFRFYVSDVALLTAAGETVPVSLTQDGVWQHDTVALLDFENKVAGCSNGTIATNTQVVGTVPADGEYVGLTFSLGVPFDLNHNDSTLAPSPLNLTSMWWNWRGGYKFLRVDLDVEVAASHETDPSQSDHHGDHGHKSDGHHPGHSGHDHGEHNHSPEPESTPTPDHPHGEHHANTGFLIHLGSTGCQVSEGSQQPTHCTHPNRITVTFPEFDPTENVVIADLGALVSESNLAANAANTPPGCMSNPNDADCLPLFETVGIAGEAQTFWRVGNR